MMLHQEGPKLYAELLATAKSDPNIVGFFLTGSRGKNMVTENSDYDATLVVKDEVLREYQDKYRGFGGMAFDLSVMNLDQLKKDAAWDSPASWNRYNYAHLKPEVDKTGELREIISEKGVIPSEKRSDFIKGVLDHYINQVYRSIKNLRDGREAASRLEAAESIPPLLDAVFALESRHKPYYKYLEWELENHPLTKLPWPKKELIDILLGILKTADYKLQQKTLIQVEKTFRKEGFSDVFDGWEEMLPWMENFKLNS